MTEDAIPSMSSSAMDPERTVIHELQDIRAKLHPFEQLWIAGYELLERHGYHLRPRLRPGWVPSWQGTDFNPFYCEDGQVHLVRFFSLQMYSG